MPVTPKAIEVDVKPRRADGRVRVIAAGDRIPWLADDFHAWFRAHGVEPNDTFQIDLVGDYIVAYRFARNEAGAKFVHKDGPRAGEIALDAPLLAEITRPVPPEHMKGGVA